MIVAIFGQMKNGKTTFAQHLQKELNTLLKDVRNPTNYMNYPYYDILNFAGAVKDQVASKYGITREAIEQWKNVSAPYPGWNVTMREALQKEGQLGRDVKSTVWIDKIPTEGNYIIDDGRYYNELEAMKKAGAYNILMTRPDEYNSNPHPSELEMGRLVKYLQGGVYPEIRDNERISMFDEIIMNNRDVSGMEYLAKGTALNILKRSGTNAKA